MTDMVKNLALLDVYGRVARLLLQLAAEQDDGRLVVSERLTQQNIADRVGASRDMVNRIFKDLSAGGYIRLENARSSSCVSLRRAGSCRRIGYFGGRRGARSAEFSAFRQPNPPSSARCRAR